MKIISTAWISSTVAEFEAHCTLSVHAKLGYQHGGVPLDVFVMEGYEKLSADFLKKYSDSGVIFHNAYEKTQEHVQKYAGVVSHLGPSQGSLYELYCFVRWLVVSDILDGEKFIHIDLDLFFQRSLAATANLFTGVTGTFGSPCLTAVSDYSWISNYRSALEALVSDRSAFESALGYAGNEFRRAISSDQDLVSALEKRDMLPKAGLGELIEKYAVFVNPIYPYIKRHPEVPQNFRTVDGIDYIGDKEVLFWHLQNNAADYLSRFFVLQNYGQSWWGEYLPVKLDLPFLQLRPSAENFAFQALRDYIVPKLNQHVREGGDLEALGFEKFFSRSWVSERFILDKMGRGIFSSAYWWEENIFV